MGIMLGILSAAGAFAQSARAPSIEEATQSELNHLGDLFIDISYMSIGSGNVDGAVGSTNEAMYIAQLAGNVQLEARAKAHRDEYRAIGLLATADAAAQKGDAQAAIALRSIGCMMLSGSEVPDPILAPIRVNTEAICSGIKSVTNFDAATIEQMSRISLILLVDANAYNRMQDPGVAIGNAMAALDIAQAIEKEDLSVRIRDLIFAYETVSMLATARIFKEEKSNVLASEKIRAKACKRIAEVSPELAPMFKEVRPQCST